MTRFEVYYFASGCADATITVEVFDTERQANDFVDEHFGVWRAWDGRERRLYVDEIWNYPTYECIC